MEKAELEKEMEKMKQELEQQNGMLEEYHNTSMDLAMSLSECFQVLGEVRKGNLDVQLSEEALNSENELMANFSQALDDTVRELRIQVETIQRQQDAIQELSTPVLQLWDNVLALPVIGIVDTRRGVEIMERLLFEITARQSRFVILDITGVEVVDTKTADHFIKIIKAAQLLGSKCIFTGIRPAVAQTLVEIGMDLGSVTTLRNLQEGLKECLRLMEQRENSGSLDS